MAYAMINLQDFATFETVAEMDETVKEYNRELTLTHYETLNELKRYSCKVVGVSHLKIETIANRLGKSIRTIKRHIKYLTDNGFITVVNTVRRVQGGSGANAYVINTKEYRTGWLRKKNNVTPFVSPREQSKKDAQTLAAKAMAFVITKKETIKSLKLYKPLSNGGEYTSHSERIESIKTARIKPDNITADLYDRYKPFFTDEQMSALHTAITNKLDDYTTLDNDQHAEIIDSVFKAIVRRLRKQYRNEADPLKNMFAFATAVATKQANKRTSMNMFAFLLE